MEKTLNLGDFNFHLKHPDNTDAQTFLNLKSHGSDSSTNQPIYNQGGLFYEIASRKSVHINYIDSGNSDHKLFCAVARCLNHLPAYDSFKLDVGIF